MNKMQIINTFAAVIACLLAVVTGFRGMSPETDAALVFVLFIVLVSSIWAGIATSDGRALEKADKQISLFRKLCDSSVLPPEHITLIRQRLKNEEQNALEIALGWRRKARRYGLGAVLATLFLFLLIPHMAEFLGQCCMIGVRSIPNSAFKPGPLQVQSYATAVVAILIFPLAVWLVLWNVFLGPVRKKVMTGVLQSLRATGDFDPVLYVTSSFRSFWSNV